MSIYDYNVPTANGENLALSTLKGKVLVIVNTVAKKTSENSLW